MGTHRFNNYWIFKKNNKMIEVKGIFYKPPHPAKANIASAAASHSKYKQ